MRFLGILSTVLTLVAVVVAVVLITGRAGIGFGRFLVIVWPVALGVAVLSGLILLFASGSAKLLTRLSNALRDEDESDENEDGESAAGPPAR